MSNKLRAILINAGLIAVCVFQLVRGYAAAIVVPCFLAFALVGNLLIFFKSRADMRARGQVNRFAMHDPNEPTTNMTDKMRKQFQARERDEHRMDGPR